MATAEPNHLGVHGAQGRVQWPKISPMNRTDREVTAEDVRFVYEVFRTDSIHKDVFETVDKIEAVDRYTLRISMRYPHADFIRQLSSPSFDIFPRECYEEKDCMKSKIITPGPWLLKENVPRQGAFWERNPEYYLKGLPYLDGIKQTDIADPNAVKAAFVTGKIDHGNWLNIPDKENFTKQVPGLQISTYNGPGGHRHYLMQLSKPPFNDVRLRQALSMAVDRVTLWELTSDGLEDTGIPIPYDQLGIAPHGPRIDQMPPAWRYDPAKAKELLTAAGHPSGLQIVLQRGTSYASGEHGNLSLGIKEMWKKNLNVDLTFNTVDGVAHSNRWYSGDWEGLYQNWCLVQACGRMDADSYLALLYGPAPVNKVNMKDATYDELFLKQRYELDPVKRQKLLWQMGLDILENAFILDWGMSYGYCFTQPWMVNTAPNMFAWCGYNMAVFTSMIDPDKKPK